LELISVTEDKMPMEPTVSFVYSSQGAQWPGMGRRLYRQEPVFRRLIAACSEVIEDRLGWSLVEEFSGDPGDVRFHMEADRVQPVVTALQLGLTELYLDRHFWPAAVTGLSMGEIAACYTAGVLSLKEAMAIACCQASLTRRTLRGGRMAMVNLDVSGVKDLLRHSKNDLSIAAELSPTLTVISGEESQIHQVIARLESQRIHCSLVRINFAFHSPEVLPLLEPFTQLLASVEAQKGLIPVYSSVTGTVQDGPCFHRDYWWRIFRDRARFHSLTKTMLSDGHRVFLEIGPHPTLLGPIAETAASDGKQVFTIRSMQRDGDELAMLQASFDTLKSLGIGTGSRPRHY
jgi:acyl transferase domain-containing protein